MERTTPDRILTAKNLKKYFPIKTGLLQRHRELVRAVDGASFSVNRGETLGLVGESGCGKTTVGRLLTRLVPPTAGEAEMYIRRNGDSPPKAYRIFELNKVDLRAFRQHIQLIFQDPFASLNPRMTVERIIGEPLKIHRLVPKAERKDRISELLEVVGLDPTYAHRYPYEFSGGQRQRIGIARALAVEPDLIIADEPVSALDVSVQSQVINLLQDLQERFDLSYIFISHGLSVVRHISHRIAVMYLGQIVELADKRQLYEKPQHPYTQALLSAVPIPNPKASQERIILTGDVPNPAEPPSGCRFHTRCPVAQPECSNRLQQLVEIEPGHRVACHVVTHSESGNPNSSASTEQSK